MRTEFETLHVERIDEHVLLVMFDRPEVRNARNTQMGLDQVELMRAKRAISAADQLDWYTGYQFELEAYNRLIATEDRKEGVQAFNARRKPEFKGC